MRGYDTNQEQAISETGADRFVDSVGSKMLQEVLGSELRDWHRSGAGRERVDASTSSVFEKSWQSDSGGKLVQLDMVTGKLLTRNDRGDKVDYESHSDAQRMSGKNSLALSSFFMLSPLAMLGMGTTFAFMNQAEQAGQSKEVNRLTEKLSGKDIQSDQANKSSQSKSIDARSGAGYTREMVLKSYLMGTDQRQSRGDSNFESRFEKEKRKAFEKWIKEADLTIKEKQKRKKESGELTRKRSRRRRFRGNDVKKLLKSKRAIEEILEGAHEQGLGLAESAKLHSQLEAIDRAIIRIGQLGV